MDYNAIARVYWANKNSSRRKNINLKLKIMRTFTFKGLFLTALLGCLSIQAADADLITKQITIKLDEAGTLPNKIGNSRKYDITNLKLVGEINGTDLRMIREMAGRDHNGDVTKGNLSVLDLSEAKIVEGGGSYCSDYYTSNDKIGDVAFSGCSGLTSIYVYAEKVPEILSDAFKGCDAKKCTVYVPKGTYDDYWLSDFGYFENIVEFDATGIDKTTTSTDVEEVSRYSVNGQRLVGPTKGLNIVKYSDGSVKKVAVE